MGRNKPHFIVDMDGTLASCEWRARECLNGDPKDWDRFFKLMVHDSPIRPIVDLVQAIYYHWHWIPIVVTGRPEKHRNDTEEWLRRFDVPFRSLFMRGNSDRRSDWIVKSEIYDNHLSHLDVRLVLDDRDSVVDMWREVGLYVVAVKDPDLEPMNEHN